MISLLGYKAEHLIGKSLYDFHHGVDSESLMATFKGCKYKKNESSYVIVVDFDLGNSILCTILSDKLATHFVLIIAN
jgi:hypothetical protein